MSMEIIIAVYIGLFALWFFYARKKNAQRKEQVSKLNALKVGDHVVTIGRMHGVVAEIDNEAQIVVLDCEGIFLTFDRVAIHHVVEEPVATETKVEEVVEEVTEDETAE